MRSSTPAEGAFLAAPRQGKEPAALREYVGARVAAFLKDEFPAPGRVKRVANATNVADDTAKSWLSGQCPQNKHLFWMMWRFGYRFSAHVFRDVDGAFARDRDTKNRIDQVFRGIDDEPLTLEEMRQRIERLTVAGHFWAQQLDRARKELPD